MSGKGGTVASIIGVFEEDEEGATVDPSSITVLTTPTLDTSGYIVSAMLGGGTPHQLHRMTVEFTTSMGEHLFHTIEFRCLPIVIG